MRGLFFELGHAVIVILRVNVIRFGEQAAWNSKSLYLGPFLVRLLGALQGNDVRVLGGSIV